MKIEILGSGCPKCKELEKRVKEAVAKEGLKAEVTHVYDIEKIIEYGVLSTPSLVVDGKVVLSGQLPSTSEISKILKGA
jgi:small redox-active disulfide protein 2